MKFVVSGYFGFRNTGDEAILAAMIEHIREIACDAGIVALSGDPAFTEELHGVRAVHRTNVPEICRELADADLFISGGGGLLQDVTGPWSVPYYLGLASLAKLLGRPVFFYAQGVGPLRRTSSRFLVRTVANWADSITVRDERSRAALESLGVRRPEIHVVADPAFGLGPGPDVPKGRDILASEGICAGSGRLIVVSVRPWKGMPGYLKTVAAACDEVARRLGAAVVFVPFHWPEDAVTSRACVELMREKAHVLERGLPPGEVLSIVGDADLVIGMRYHSLVFAAASAIPFVAVSYDPKVDALLSAMGETPGISPGETDADELVRKIMDVWSRREAMGASLARLSPRLAEAARQTARFAVETVRSRPKRR